MALDVAEFLWNKFFKSLAELESESRSGLVTISFFNSSIKDVVSKFKEIKDDVNERDIMPQRYTYSETIDIFYKLNDALSECRVIVHECKEIKNKLSSINPRRFISLNTVNDTLKKIKDQLQLQKLEPSTQEIDSSLTMTGPMLSSKVSGFDEKSVSGFDEKSKKIEELLLGGSGSSSTGVTFTKIAVIGMAGVGKTTLVQKVLGSKKVNGKFSRIIWIPFSGIREGEQISRFNFETCILDDLGKILKGTPERIVGLDSLLETLHKQISDKCYLIVLDDVCFQVINIMERLVSGLPKASAGAVIATSRLTEVAQKLGEHYHFVRVKPLAPEDCSSIFEKTIEDENKLPSISPEDTSRKEEMKVQCHGLPLLAKALAQIFPKEHVSSQEMSQSTEIEVPSFPDEEMIDKSDALKNIRRSYGDLQGTELKVCLLSLSIFPEGSVIRKRPLIYWWIGEGFITATKEKTAEEIGEDIFAKLLRKDLIQPDPDESNCASLVKNCIIHPWIRRMLISLAKEARLFDFNPKWPMMPSDSISTCRRSCLVSNEETHQGDDRLKNLLTVFNVNIQNLDLKQEWLDKLKRVEVLHFGRWQSSPKYHIEVNQKTFDGSQAVGFLNGLGAQKHLKYLSLRGISRISTLPASIRSLISLEILDLRACHDLERLPSDISSLKKLTHLDVAECYLLEGMPKGLHRLSSLQVLKGFLIGSEEKTPFKLGDLAKLKYLRRLSIHIGSEAAVQPGEFGKLKDMLSLRYLKISWGVDPGNESNALFFPPNLEKLDLQGFPLSTAPDGLKPSKLKNLKKLYIRGGKLGSLEHMNEKPVQHEEPVQWKVEILRLKYLEALSTNSAEVDRIFPNLKYLAVDEKNLSKAES